MNYNDAIQEMMDIDSQEPRPCIICLNMTFNRGAFIPDNSVEFGAPPGKQRVIVYPLCKKHKRDRATGDWIEELILEDMAIHPVRFI